MWRVTVYIVTIWLLVQVNARPEISLEELLERLVTLEDWKRETDTDISNLRETVEHQETTIRNLERDLAIQVNLTSSLKPCNGGKNENTEEAMDEAHDNVREGQTINQEAVNRRAIPMSVAFTVYLDQNVVLGAKQTIKFDKIITNDGEGYNPFSGVFTCPQSGLYLFSFCVGERSGSGNAGIWAGLIVNNTLVVDGVADTFHTYQDLQGGNMAVVRLTKGDDVWVDSTGRYDVEGDTTLRLTTFTGVLLYPNID